jgi:hypothetical protein
MKTDDVETGRKSDVAATAGKQAIEPQRRSSPEPEAAAPTVRPWTSDFLLPSISYREPKRADS